MGGGDVKTQWYPFFELNKRTTLKALEDHTLPFYSFILFLGSNIWASKASYGLFDLYNIIFYFFDNNYFLIYDIQCLIKILISGITFYFLIDYIFKNQKVSFIGGLCYALSSYCIYFTAQPGFLSFYSLAPLYFLGIEKYLNNNKKILFILMVFLLLITNYYFFYAISVFSPIYFIYRYFNINKTLKGLIRKALLLIAYYLVGVFISGVIVVPTFLFITQNERVGDFYTGLTFDDLSIYLHLMMSTFVPSHTYIYGNNIFAQSAHTMNEILLYSGSIVSILVPQFLTDKNKNYKVSTSVLYIVLLIMMFIPIFDSIMNGLSEPCFRWLFLFITMNIVVSCRYLTELDNINKHNLLISFFIEISLVIFCFARGLIYNNYLLSNYLLQVALLAIVMLFTLLNVWSLLKDKNIIVVTVIELVSFTMFYGYKSLESSVSKEEISELTNVLADNNNIYGLTDYLNSLDADNCNQYYRVYVPYYSLYWSFSHNLNIIYNINGLMTYDSTYNQSFNKMKSIASDKVSGLIGWEFDIQDSDLMSFLSTKYSITSNVEEIPFENYEIVDDSYRGTLIVSLNKDYRAIGSTYSKYISYEDLKNEYNNDTKCLNEFVVSDNDISSYIGDDICSMYNIQYYDNYFHGEIDCSDKSFVVLGLPFDDGWKITNNGESVDYYECNGGMIGFPVNSGSNFIDMYFVPKGFKLGTVCSGIGTLALFCLIIKELRNKY